MRFNAHKENIVFQKNKKIKNVSHSNVQPIMVIEDIEKIYSNKEEVYIFESGDKAKFLYERSCVNDLSFNYFQVYNESVYNCLHEIKKILDKLIEDNNINKKRNLYYIASEYEVNFLEKYWYDTGGSSTNNFSGYWFLDTEEGSYIDINGEQHGVSIGSVIVFHAGSKTSFVNVNKAISFNITTLSKLVGQYPQKWMPI